MTVAPTRPIAHAVTAMRGLRSIAVLGDASLDPYAVAGRLGLLCHPGHASISSSERWSFMRVLALKVARGRSLQLLCHCAPLRCHALQDVKFESTRSITPVISLGSLGQTVTAHYLTQWRFTWRTGSPRLPQEHSLLIVQDPDQAQNADAEREFSNVSLMLFCVRCLVHGEYTIMVLVD